MDMFFTLEELSFLRSSLVSQLLYLCSLPLILLLEERLQLVRSFILQEDLL